MYKALTSEEVYDLLVECNAKYNTWITAQDIVEAHLVTNPTLTDVEVGNLLKIVASRLNVMTKDPSNGLALSLAPTRVKNASSKAGAGNRHGYKVKVKLNMFKF